jgi:uncharacterized protein YjbI with pentapeptide repeats
VEVKKKIKSLTGKILFQSEEARSWRQTVEAAVAALSELVEADLSHTPLCGANLSGAHLSDADLSYADFSRANLSRADLSGANLSGANVSGANLSEANLSGAILTGAVLSRADLSRADLSRANLDGVDFSGADLSRANLSISNLLGANLSRADLCKANLSRANLTRANFSCANLSDADLYDVKNGELALAQTSIVPEEGSFIAWKKCRNGVMVKLEIPAQSERLNASGRRCRAEYAKVLEVIGGSKGISLHDSNTIYEVGKTVYCDNWNTNRWVECGGGIHFMLTRIEAENFF